MFPEPLVIKNYSCLWIHGRVKINPEKHCFSGWFNRIHCLDRHMIISALDLVSNAPGAGTGSGKVWSRKTSALLGYRFLSEMEIDILSGRYLTGSRRYLLYLLPETIPGFFPNPLSEEFPCKKKKDYASFLALIRFRRKRLFTFHLIKTHLDKITCFS